MDCDFVAVAAGTAVALAHFLPHGRAALRAYILDGKLGQAIFVFALALVAANFWAALRELLAAGGRYLDVPGEG